MKRLHKIILLVAAMTMLPLAASAAPFETNTSPTDYPIQWYKLKANGQYLYALSYGELSCSSSSSSSDEYLWCFITLSSGKIVIYNKERKQYMYQIWNFTQYMYQPQTNYVKLGSGNTFNICYDETPTRTYYLNCDEGGVFGSVSSQCDFTAVPALYEDFIEPTGQVVFSDLEVHDDYCSFYYNFFPGETDSGAEMRLYVNGAWVNMPYQVQRTSEVQTIEAEARVIFVNPRIRPIVVTKTYEIPARTVAKGDVDGNGEVNGNDLNTLINILLGKDNAANYDGRANVDGQGGVDGNDLNALINILLGK